MLLNQMSKDIYSWKSECLFLTQKHYVLWICCRIWTCLTLLQEGITAKTALSRAPNHPSNDLNPCPCTDFITHTTDQGCFILCIHLQKGLFCIYLSEMFTKGLSVRLSPAYIIHLRWNLSNDNDIKEESYVEYLLLKLAVYCVRDLCDILFSASFP